MRLSDQEWDRIKGAVVPPLPKTRATAFLAHDIEQRAVTERDAMRKLGMLEAAEIALAMFNKSGNGECGCGQCIYTAIKKAAE